VDVKMRLPSLPAVEASRPIAPAAVNAASATGSVVSTTAPTRVGPQFANVLDEALSSVSDIQNDATRLQTRFQAGAPGATLEETMVSMQKAQIAFTSAVTVRNRLVSAYTDIMNMNV